MKIEAMKRLVGRVIALDLVNRERPVVKIVKVSDDGVVSITNPIIYMPIPKPGSTEEYAVAPVPYAAPLFNVTKMDIHVDHIISVIDVPANMEQAYVSQFGGIVTPKASGIVLPN